MKKLFLLPLMGILLFCIASVPPGNHSTIEGVVTNVAQGDSLAGVQVTALAQGKSGAAKPTPRASIPSSLIRVPTR
jgi:hypothetical protein